VTLRAVPPPQPPPKEATCVYCSTGFPVKVVCQNEESVVYEGNCPTCESYALLTYMASAPKKEEDPVT